MLKNLLKTISDPILYYVDKSGNSVFRNYCIFRKTGCLYETSIPKKNAGKTLEYRLLLDKYLKRVYFWTPVILYLIFIHINFSLQALLFFEIIWLLIVNSVRIVFSCMFSRHLTKTFGKYNLIEFKPPVSSEKFKEYTSLFFSKLTVLVILLGIFFSFSFVLEYFIKLNATSKHQFPKTIGLSKLYFALYPKNDAIYDYCAYVKYRQKDLKGAIKYYTKVLDMSGKTFEKRDLARLANLLYLKKLVSSPNEAIDLFNEYSTKKNTTVLEDSQLLWIKSIFRIENSISDTIIQDYEDLLASLDQEDMNNWFYISSDEAYVLYLMRDYSNAIVLYNLIISYAETHKEYSKELKTLYVERGFAKRQAGDIDGANNDFILSQFKPWEIAQHEPTYSNQEFLFIKH